MVYQSHLFKTPEDEARFNKIYDAVWTYHGLAPEELKIHTSFGETHVNAFGRKDSPSLVLLPGYGAPSIVFIPNIEVLLHHFRIYAVDNIDDIGKSRLEKSFNGDKIHADWLKEVFQGLHLEKSFIAGLSYGGWIAIEFLLSSAQCIEKAALFAPAASFEKLSFGFISRIIFLGLIPIKPIRQRLILNFFKWIGSNPEDVAEDDPVLALMRFSFENRKRTEKEDLPRIRVFTDEELGRIATPTLLLVGDKEVIYNPERVIARAKNTMPNVTAELVPDGTHSMTNYQKDLINARMIDFFKN